MIVVDTSALCAVIFGEDAAESIIELLHGNEVCVSAATLIESGIVVEGRAGVEGALELRGLVTSAAVEVEPVSHAQADLAVIAWRRFGKGRHPAALNYGDCFSYALASALDVPLLFVGNDFAQTDIRAAL